MMPQWVRPARQVCATGIPVLTHPPVLGWRAAASALVSNLLSSDELGKQA